MSGLIRIQTAWHPDVIPERIFRKNQFWKKWADDKKGMQNYPACNVFISYLFVSFCLVLLFLIFFVLIFIILQKTQKNHAAFFHLLHSSPILIRLTLKAQIATKVVCFSRLLKCLRSLYDKQCGPIGAVWSGSTLFASILESVSNVRQLFAADNFSRGHFSDAFFLGALRANFRIPVSND